MSLSNRTRGILLQVAFKEAAENVRNGIISSDELVQDTESNFTVLVDLFNKYDIVDTQGDSTAPSAGSDAPVVTIDGQEWYDFRGLKALGVVKDKHPDFKTPDGKQSKWLTTKDGNPTQFANVVEKAGV